MGQSYSERMTVRRLAQKISELVVILVLLRQIIDCFNGLARDMDLRNTIKNGVLYLEDPVDKEWNPHFFVLTQHRLFYTGTFQGNQDGDEDGESEDVPAGPVSQARLREVVKLRLSMKLAEFTLFRLFSLAKSVVGCIRWPEIDVFVVCPPRGYRMTSFISARNGSTANCLAEEPKRRICSSNIRIWETVLSSYGRVKHSSVTTHCRFGK